MEDELHIFDTGIDWSYKGIRHPTRVSYLAENYEDFIEKIKRDYGFADECMIYDVKHIIYLPYEVKYIKRRAENDLYSSQRQKSRLL